MNKAYAILTAMGWYTPSRTVTRDGPPRLYATERNAYKAILTNAGTQLKGGVVVEIEWRSDL